MGVAGDGVRGGRRELPGRVAAQVADPVQDGEARRRGERRHGGQPAADGAPGAAAVGVRVPAVRARRRRVGARAAARAPVRGGAPAVSGERGAGVAPPPRRQPQPQRLLRHAVTDPIDISVRPTSGASFCDAPHILRACCFRSVFFRVNGFIFIVAPNGPRDNQRFLHHFSYSSYIAKPKATPQDSATDASLRSREPFRSV